MMTGIQYSTLKAWLLGGVFFAVFLFISILLAPERKIEHTISSKDLTTLELLINKLPHNSHLFLDYQDKTDSGRRVLSDDEYHYFKQKVDLLYNSESRETDLKQTPLEKARANLRAFDEVGAIVVPKELVSEVREKLVAKIKLLEDEKINK